MWHGVDGMGWWMLWGGIMMLLFWGGVIFLAVWLVQSVTGRSGDGTRRGPADAGAAEIARERYARGEITRDEYLQIKRDLESA